MPDCVWFGGQRAAAFSQEERTVCLGTSWPLGLYLPSESLLLSLRVNLVPLLARHLTPSGRPSASWQDQRSRVFWQDFQAEGCSPHRTRGLPQERVHFAQRLAEQQAGGQPGSELTADTAGLILCCLGAASRPQIPGVHEGMGEASRIGTLPGRALGSQASWDTRCN